MIDVSAQITISRSDRLHASRLTSNDVTFVTDIQTFFQVQPSWFAARNRGAG
jgi:hypothetical protein